MPEDVQIVSVDDHLIEHPNVWQDRLPAKYKDAGPRNLEDEDGNDVWEFDGRRSYNIGLNAVAGKRREDYGVEPTRFADMLPGCHDRKQRVKDMDIEGVQAQLCFPGFPGFAGSTFFNATDKDLAAACVLAWNDWMIDEWCAANPGRQIPLALVERIGVDNIMFESDYPHSDSNWPHTRKMLAESLAHLADDMARKIAEDNARRVFNFPRV